MTHISFHNTNQTKTAGFIAELAVLQGKFKPFADLYEAIEAGIVTPKIFEPEDVEKHGYIVMLVGHNDEQLVEWGEKIGLLRGFPIRWKPNESWQICGFRQKFLNDNRAIPIDTVFKKVGGFRKVSGYLGQMLAWEVDGELFWTACSKNSASCDVDSQSKMSFAADAARIFSEVVSEELLREMVDEGIHFCAEMMSNEDAQHGEIPRKEAGVVTTVGKGIRLIKDASGEWQINIDREKGYVDFFNFRETIAFCLKHNLHVGTAIVAKDKAAERFMELLKEGRDMMTDSRYQAIIDQVKGEFPEDFEEILGNCTHLEILGEGLEGLVVHALKEDGTLIIYKLKFPKYTSLTMCLREMLKKYSMKDPNLILDEILKWRLRWCTTDEGREYWSDYIWSCIFKMKTIKKDSTNPIGWHLRLAKATNEEWESGDISTIRKAVQEEVGKRIAEAPPALREVITVVYPFSRDYSKIVAELNEAGYPSTEKMAPLKKTRGCVMLRDVPLVPSDKTGTIYQLPTPLTDLANWQERKLEQVDPQVKIVPSIEELLPMIQADLKAKMPKVDELTPMEILIRQRIQELTEVIRRKAEMSTIPLLVMLVGPQCIGKSHMFSELSDIFEHCSADNYMPEKFNGALLQQNHAKCAMDAFRALEAGKNAIVDNTNMEAENRTIYKKIADILGAQLLMIPICEDLWLTGSEYNKDLVKTLVIRAETRERKFDRDSEGIITGTIEKGRADFKKYGSDLNTWLYNFPAPTRPSGVYIGREGYLLYRSPEIDALVTEALKDPRLADMGQKLLEKQIWRGVGESHITLASMKELKKPIRRKLKEEEVKEQMKTPGPFTSKGIGRAEKDGEMVYFLVVDWAWGDSFRKDVLGLEKPQQFHITLCWTGKGDIHGVEKGTPSLEW